MPLFNNSYSFSHKWCWVARCHKYSEELIGAYLFNPSRQDTDVSSSGPMKYTSDLRVLRFKWSSLGSRTRWFYKTIMYCTIKLLTCEKLFSDLCELVLKLRIIPKVLQAFFCCQEQTQKFFALITVETNASEVHLCIMSPTLTITVPSGGWVSTHEPSRLCTYRNLAKNLSTTLEKQST